MHDLEVAARSVIANWEKGNLAQAVRELDLAVRSQDLGRLECAQAIQTARSHFTEDECVIDELPLVAPGEKGAFIGVWIWIPQSS